MAGPGASGGGAPGGRRPRPGALAGARRRGRAGGRLAGGGRLAEEVRLRGALEIQHGAVGLDLPEVPVAVARALPTAGQRDGERWHLEGSGLGFALEPLDQGGEVDLVGGAGVLLWDVEAGGESLAALAPRRDHGQGIEQ